MSSRDTPSKASSIAEEPPPGGDSLGSVSYGHTGESDLVDPFLERIAEAGVQSAGMVPPTIGTVLGGKYRILSTVGRGGMGFVYRAIHVVTGRVIALKWMLPRRDLEHLRRRFLREAEAIGRARHPNVVDIYDVESTENATYLVMELLEGETLRARLSRGPLPVDDAIELCLALLDALRVAHQKGVIHRDLKPENVFLAGGDGGEIVPKILDFGISTLTESENPERSNTLTQTGHFVGTPLYTALERLREKPFDHRVDLYSVGVILYESLLGTLPFNGQSVAELTYQLVTTEPAFIRARRPEVSPALEALISRALSRDPDERPADAESFAAALRAAGAHPSWRVRSSRFWATVAAGAIVTGAALVAALSDPSARRGAPDPVREVSRTQVSAALPTTPNPVTDRSVVPKTEGSPPREIVNGPVSAPTEAPRPQAVASAHPRLRSDRSSGSTSALSTASPPGAVIDAAQLTVVVFPFGKVWIDGNRVGASPITKSISAGTHVISGGRDAPERQSTVTLDPGDSKRVVLSLQPRSP